MGGKRWTDDELALLADRGMSHALVADLIGRSHVAVRSQRSKINLGHQPPVDGWSDVEMAFLADNLTMKTSDVSSFLLRSQPSVRTQRRRLLDKAVGDGRKRIAVTSPTHVGQRVLLAKTCPDCGLLLDAKFFRDGKHWRQICGPCHRERYEDRNRIRKQPTKEQRHRSWKHLQAMTLPAPNNGKEWTSRDEEVILDESKSNLQKAWLLGRSYFAVVSRAVKIGARSTPESSVGSVEDGQWHIRFPETG